MGATENIKLIKARYEAVNAHDFDKFQGFYGSSIAWQDPGLPAAIKGPVAVRRRLEDLTTTFPDLKWKLGRIFSQGEHVSAEFTFTGTHKGTHTDKRSKQSLRATNQKIRIEAVGVYTIRNNKIVDSKIYFDLGSLNAQLQKQGAGPRKSKS
jgi:steroid delta-isomerase-like uncharacterized protein